MVPVHARRHLVAALVGVLALARAGPKADGKSDLNELITDLGCLGQVLRPVANGSSAELTQAWRSNLRLSQEALEELHRSLREGPPELAFEAKVRRLCTATWALSAWVQNRRFEGLEMKGRRQKGKDWLRTGADLLSVRNSPILRIQPDHGIDTCRAFLDAHRDLLRAFADGAPVLRPWLGDLLRYTATAAFDYRDIREALSREHVILFELYWEEIRGSEGPVRAILARLSADCWFAAKDRRKNLLPGLEADLGGLGAVFTGGLENMEPAREFLKELAAALR